MKLILLFIFAIFSSVQSFADAPCLDIINPHQTFNRVLDASELSLSNILLPNDSYLETAMDKLGIKEAKDRAVFSRALTVKPVLDAGVLYEAIAAEAMVLGYKDKDKMMGLLRNFGVLPVDQKKTFINGVVESLQFALGERIDLSNVNSIAEKARRFQVTEDEMACFLKTYQVLATSEGDEIRIVILDLLLQNNAVTTKRITQYISNFKRFFMDARYTLRPQVLFTADGAFDMNSVTEYLKKATTKMAFPFIMENWIKFDLVQLLYIETYFLPSIPDYLKPVIALRIELLKAQNELVQAEKQATAFKSSSLKSDPQMQPDDIEKLINPLQLFSGGSDKYSALNKVMTANKDRLDSPGLLRAGQAIFNVAETAKESNYFGDIIRQAIPSSVIYMSEVDFAELILGALQKVKNSSSGSDAYGVANAIVSRVKERQQLALDSEVRIKDGIIALSQHFAGSNYAGDIMALAAGALTKKPIPSYLVLETQIENLKNKVEDTQKNLNLAMNALREHP